LQSLMHMAWVRTICGRLKSDYRYSAGIVYNNFPWPKPTPQQKAAIEKAAQNILNIREKYTNSTLADLYDPLVTPEVLLKAHLALDKAVDSAYKKPKNKENLTSDAERVAFLFGLYEEITNANP